MGDDAPLVPKKGKDYGAADEGAKAPEFSAEYMALLQTPKAGLTAADAALRLQRFGKNQLPEKEDNKWQQFLLEFVQPMPMMIWFAIFIECVQLVVEGEVVAIVDILVLLVLQVLNVVIGFYEELKAGDEVAALRASLRPEAIVIREGKPERIDASTVVPGDRVVLAAGAAVPADCAVAEGEKPIQVDQAALTGESLPVTMVPGSVAKMGSTITRGESESICHATGADTFFGKTAALINIVESRPHFEIVLQELLIMLVCLGLTVCLTIFVDLMVRHQDFWAVMSFVVVLLIASIPVALRVVCTCTLALGCKELAAEKAIVSRLSSVEELAGMDILCSDKTGTLTLNKMELQDDLPLFEPGYDRAWVLKLAALAAKWWEPAKDALDTLVMNAVDCDKLTTDGYQQTDYTPFDPTLKRTEAEVTTPTGDKLSVMKGAPHVLLDLCPGNKDAVHDEVTQKVDELAYRGIRSLAVALSKNGEPQRFIGILTFLDPPRPDTKRTIAKAREFGVEVKMITGDHKAIASETCRQLGLGDQVQGSDKLPMLSIEEMSEGNPRNAQLGSEYGGTFETTDGFAQVFPEHKFLIVEALRQRGHLIGMTGDGVNDAPALKRADVGIAVSGATGAAQAASDIVLTQEGLSTIVLAIVTSRRIFQRMKNFVIYRVACTQQLLFFFFISGVFVDPSDHNLLGTDHGFFFIPVIALVSITLLNDGTIISVAYDNVDARRSPEKWNLNVLYIISSAIGMTALVGSVIMLLVGLHGADHKLWYNLNLESLDIKRLQTVMYLKISLSDYASVFNARCRGWMWERAPSPIVLLAAAFAMVVATLLAITFPPGMGSIELKTCAYIWLYTVVWALFQDATKVFTYYVLGQFGISDDNATITAEEMDEFQSLCKEDSRKYGEV